MLTGALSYFFLPERFLYDAVTITQDLYNEKGWVGSYPVTMSFYAYSLLGRLHFSLVALIQLPILLFIIYKIGIADSFSHPTLKNVVVYVSLFLLAFFISMPSKEFITFSFLSLIPFLFKRKKYNIKMTVFLSFLIFIFFGVWFRPYFVFIPILALVMHGLGFIKIKNKIALNILGGLLVAVFLSLSYGVVHGQFLSESTREELNLFRAQSEDANSMITSPVSTSSWYGEAVGIFYGFFTVNFPLNGLRHIFKPQIVAFIFWQLLLFGFLIYYFKNCLAHKEKYKYEIWIFYFVFSYFIIQGIFEPDLGSAVRHKIGFFPLIYYALYYDYFRLKIQ
ncbi:MAG: hypothetical protein V7767_11995 [Leeuwenhoekiella sp.]